MTTNHLSRLDPALIRPGRVDLLEYIDDALPTQAKQLFMRFYVGDENVQDDSELRIMASALEENIEAEMKAGKRVSMAALQGLFIRSSAKDAVKQCRDLAVVR